MSVTCTPSEMITSNPPESYQFGYGDYNPNTVVFCSAGDEMLKISDKEFLVRGVKVKQDAGEAEAVYKAFKAWLTWVQLNGYTK